MTDFPAATVDALVNQNKALQARLNQSLAHTRDLENKLDQIQRDVMTSAILTNEGEAEIKKLEAELGSLRLERLHLTQTQSSAEMQLVELMSAQKHLEDQTRSALEKAKRAEGMYERLKGRIRKWIRPKWLLIQPEFQRYRLFEMKFRERNRVLKEQLESATAHIQNQELSHRKIMSELRNEQHTESQTNKTLLNTANELTQTKSREYNILDDKYKTLRTENLRLKNEQISKVRHESAAQSELLKRIEDQQSRIFILMTENKKLQSDLKDMQNFASEQKYAREKSEANWSELRLKYQTLEKEFSEISLALKAHQHISLDPRSLEEIKDTLESLESSLQNEKIVEGANESFDEIKLEMPTNSDSSTNEDEDVVPEKIIDPKLSQIDKDLLEIQSEYFRLTT